MPVTLYANQGEIWRVVAGHPCAVTNNPPVVMKKAGIYLLKNILFFPLLVLNGIYHFRTFFLFSRGRRSKWKQVAGKRHPGSSQPARAGYDLPARHVVVVDTSHRPIGVLTRKSLMPWRTPWLDEERKQFAIFLFFLARVVLWDTWRGGFPRKA